MSQHLNIVSFDVPYPANYGGAIDVFYKIKWLHGAGIKIHLHCFTYGRAPSPELEALCEETFYYRRKVGFWSNLSLLPYTVQSRRSKQLKVNLLRNDHPILFEVLHTCYLLKDVDLAGRKKIFRHSNIEHAYYYEIAKAERHIVRKLFHYIEGWKLKRFERVLEHAQLILAVNEKDTAYFRQKYPRVPSIYLPSFHASNSVEIQEGRGSFALIHGNLGVAENYEAVTWLLQKVLSVARVKTIVAGLNPPAFLSKEARKYAHVQLIANPPDSQMDELMKHAQVHLLYTAQPTGLKLKLLNVLFNGRFVLCNRNMLSGTGLAANRGLVVADSAEDFSAGLLALMGSDFTRRLVDERSGLIGRFDNKSNVSSLVRAIFGS